MQLGPWLITRGIGIVVLFILLASFALTRTTPGAAEKPSNTTHAGNLSESAPASQSLENGSSCEVSSAYPIEVRDWCDLITKYAKENKLHPDLIAGLIWYESGGDPNAYSKSGAVGLMQVMPRDGLAAEFMCINGPCFAKRPTISELENPEFNIDYGTRMLAGLQNRYNDLREALKSYGPANYGYAYADKVLAIFDTYRSD